MQGGLIAPHPPLIYLHLYLDPSGRLQVMFEIAVGYLQKHWLKLHKQQFYIHAKSHTLGVSLTPLG